MRYHVLACDYDGTLAHQGRVSESTLAALERLLATGRKLVMVTGRELSELLEIFPRIDMFERVVYENGASIYVPATKEIRVLGHAPPEAFIRDLQKRGVSPMSVGSVIVASWKPHETAMLETIRDHGLDLQVIFNKEAVMLLPAGINKATGLSEALTELGFSLHETVGIGDAENDLAFLSGCECGAAVANALPAVQKRVDLITQGARGEGVEELIDRLIATDLQGLETCLARHELLFGTDSAGAEVKLASYGFNLLIAGPSGSGKSTAATSFLERLNEHHYQYCIIDPEGDYQNLDGAVMLGNNQHGPTAAEVLQLLANARENAVVNLVGLPIGDRPPFFLSLLPGLQEMRARTGRPHWLIVDEAHHLLPASWEPGSVVLPRDFNRMVFITVHPDKVMPGIMRQVSKVVAVGPKPAETIEQFCAVVGETYSQFAAPELDSGDVYLWSRSEKTGTKVRLEKCRTERRRHTRKYAEGELPPERSFYFRGPKDKLNLRAQNLILFLQLADGVDDETWLFHLLKGDYSQWIRKRIKDETLAEEVAQVEQIKRPTADESRRLVREAVERYYTQTAGPPLPMPGTAAASKRE